MTLLNRVRNALLPEGTLCMPLKAKSTTRAISVTALKIVAHHGSLSRNQRYSSTPFTGMATTPARGRHHYLSKEVNLWQKCTCNPPELSLAVRLRASADGTSVRRADPITVPCSRPSALLCV